METKTPTLEEIKEYFKNAKEINTPFGGINYKIDVLKYGVFYDDKYVIRQKENENFEKILLYYNGEYSKIISYKDEPKDGGNCINDFETPKHYDNSKGTLYKVATERGWNSYLFDIVKRLERAEKKGEFKTDLEKSINVIKLWLQENENNRNA